MDRLLMGLQVTVIGMLVVFIGLIMLLGILYASEYLFRKYGQKTPETSSAPEPVAELEPIEPMEAEDDSVIAAISAAVAIMSEIETDGSLVIRSIRRVGKAWGSAGR